MFRVLTIRASNITEVGDADNAPGTQHFCLESFQC